MSKLKHTFSLKTRILMKVVKIAGAIQKWCWRRMPGFCERCGTYAGMTQAFCGGHRLCPKCFDAARKEQEK